MKAVRKPNATTTRTPAKHPTSEAGPLDRWLEGDDFTPIDRHFARFMERLCGGTNLEVTTAAALASRGQGQGSICLDLRSVAGTTFPASPSVGGVGFQLPALADWIHALRQAPVVGRPSEFKPLVLDEDGRLYLHRYWQYESELAKAILLRAAAQPGEMDEAILEESLTRLFPDAPASGEIDWQRVAAATAVRRRLCVISGGPGTGKTRTVVALLVLLLEQARQKPPRIALAAPTGKAAARLQESLKKWKSSLPCDDTIKALLPDESFTLHRLLEGRPDSAQFKHHAGNPLPFDVVVVDEASMVDLALMAKLFAAMPPSARLVLLGDKDQLASVEAGAVLGDLCAGANTEVVAESPASPEGLEQSMATQQSGVAAPENRRAPKPLADCVVELRRNYRFAADSGILALSQAINSGDADGALKLLNTAAASAEHRSRATTASNLLTGIRRHGSGISVATLPSPARLMERLRTRVLEGFGEATRAPEPLAALQALSRFRILCAVRHGPFGVEAVNRMVEEILVEAGLVSIRDRWYVGRPVMVNRNDYNLRLFNGDVGILLPDAGSGELRSWFLGTDNSLRSIPPIRLPAHETVFAMTVHKSQGSEFEDVLLILPDHESPVLTRELLYTGVTRASRRVELWFADTVFRTAVGRRVERTSGLRDSLWGAGTA